MNRLPHLTTSWTAYLTWQQHEPLTSLHSTTPHKTTVHNIPLQEPQNLHCLQIFHFVTNNISWQASWTLITDMEKNWSRLNSSNAPHPSVQNILRPRLLWKDINFEIYRTVILSVVCIGVKLGLSYWVQNMVMLNVAMGKVFGPKWEEVTDWRESGTVKFVLVQCYWGDELSGCVAHVKEGTNSYRILMGKPVGRRPLGILWCRWQSSIKWVVRK